MLEKMKQKEMEKRPSNGPTYWWKKASDETATCRVTPRPGHTCPKCGEGTLTYDGLFILTCDACGQVAETGVFT